MYSILIRDDVDATKWTYYLDADEAVWQGTKEEAESEINKILVFNLSIFKFNSLF